MKTFSFLVSVIIFLFIATPNKVTAQRAKAIKTVTGTILKVEWGDNFYLTIVDSKGKKHTALCKAPICTKFNETTELPKKYRGKRVSVTVGKGKRYDGGGTFMDTYPAFTKIK
jgi:hypothetical protein